MQNSISKTRAFCAVWLLIGTVAAQADWSSDPNVNLAVADLSGDQVQPKIKATSDGGCYISWYDNNSGGYDVYLQRLNAGGAEQWPHNGVLIANRSFSSTQDYGLDVDPSGNAILAFRDDRGAGVQIYAQLIDPSGVAQWGAGVQVSVTAGGNSPHVAATSDGEYVIGWTINAGFRLQRLDAFGVEQWASDGIVQEPTTGSYMISELVGSDAGAVIALWVRPIGDFLSDKHLYTQKYNTAGTAVWDSNPGTPLTPDPVQVFDSGSVQFGYFPTFLSDGAGGGVYGWYAVNGPRDCYVQHVSAVGAELFTHNGVSASIQANRYQLSAALGYDEVAGEPFLAWTESNTVQSQWGLYAQRFSNTGVRLWGANGLEILPLSGTQNFYANTLAYDGGAIVTALSSSSSGTVLAARFDSAGAPVWTPSPSDACSVVSGKSRLNTVLSSAGVALLAWEDSRAGNSDIYAQNINPDGSLGVDPCPADLDGDGDVDLSDLAALLANYGTTSGANPEDGDLDGDGDVDLADLAALLAVYGTTCN